MPINPGDGAGGGRTKPRNTAGEHPICSKRIGRLTPQPPQDCTGDQGARASMRTRRPDTLIRERDQSIRRAAETSIQMVVEHENRRMLNNWRRPG
ncbi:MAG: hypothetical protein IPK44_15115 [Candidatus Accumulibacter sp.]|uniref:hypothetical protein n=1 Tax=Accumulibacter sp. TaxID=2053492 RepID=UPI00258BF8BA|nr:hypothetical protein [Accumulibacter sp.]MBK8115738.1 hypothetical protein [Accumulibacter sp.]